MPRVSPARPSAMRLLREAAVYARRDRARAADVPGARADDARLVALADDHAVAGQRVAAVLRERCGPQRDERQDGVQDVVAGVDRDEAERVVATGDSGDRDDDV